MATHTRALLTNTRILFSGLLQSAGVDCVCDIGSRDGMDALRFHQLFPQARLLAFEANPHNFASMMANPRLRDAKIEILPYAVSNMRGKTTFNITTDDPDGISGTSSLLSGGSIAVKEVVHVETRRLDELIKEKCPASRCLGLWVDVEGAESLVFEGLSDIRDRVAVIHVETAVKPMRAGQRTMAELTAQLDKLGFDFVAAGFAEEDVWGDAVYMNRAMRARIGWAYGRCKIKARLSAILRIDHVALFLYKRLPWLHRIAYRMYHRLGARKAA